MKKKLTLTINEEILKTARKGIKPTDVRAVVEACQKLRISAVGTFIIGLPGETPETAEETIRFACSLPLTMAIFFVLMPYPGTKAFEDYYKADPDSPTDYQEFLASKAMGYAKGYTGLNGLTLEQLPALVAHTRFECI